MTGAAGLPTGNGNQKGAAMSTVSRFDTVKGRVSLRDYANAHLEHLSNGKLVCPCGSGTGPKGTPAFSITPDGKRWKCFVCQKSGDVFDLAGYVHGTEDRTEQYRLVCEWAGIDCEREPRSGAFGWGDEARTADRPDPTPQKRRIPDYSAGREREREYIERCRANMTPDCEGMAYLQARGFSADEVERFGIGWDGMKRRVILPWSTRPGEWYHIDRDVSGTHPHKYVKPKREDVGPQPFHNIAALDGSYLFVVEGVLDAYAVMVCGYPAVSLAGTGHRDFVRELVGRKYAGVVIAMLDFDEPGRNAQADMVKALKDAGIHYVAAEWGTPAPLFKDAGEALEADRGCLADMLQSNAAYATEKLENEAESLYAETMANLHVADPVDVAMSLYSLTDPDEPIPTGIRRLDMALDGGLRRGLCVLGAVSSLGKTTLAAQIADNIAASGRSVLFVTIEQTAQDIVAKSLSRMMREADGGEAVSTRSIMSASAREGWSPEKCALFYRVCERYADEVAPNLHIMEGVERPSVESIARAALELMRHDGEAPVVFIDYLQLLAPQNERDTEKLATDKNVTVLRQLANALKAPVFVISSLNRASYSGCVSLDSFKESGGIEYGADVLLGLQPYNIREELAECKSDWQRKKEVERIMNELKASTERACEIVVLKQRTGGVPSGAVPVTFYPVVSTFVGSVTRWGEN